MSCDDDVFWDVGQLAFGAPPGDSEQEFGDPIQQSVG
jgi:hypothetical protein